MSLPSFELNGSLHLVFISINKLLTKEMTDEWIICFQNKKMSSILETRRSLEITLLQTYS